MIINFSVENFGSIKDKQTLSFEAEKNPHLEDYYVIKNEDKKIRLLKIGLIYGANASGKTTILEALNFLRNLVVAPKGKKDLHLDYEPFLFDEKTAKQNTKLEITFYQNKKKYCYYIEFNKKAIISEILNINYPKKSNIFKRTTDIEKQLSIIEFDKKINIDKNVINALQNNTLWNNTVLGGFLKTNMDSAELRDVCNWFQNYFMPILYPQQYMYNDVSKKIEKDEIDKFNVINILKKADFNISDIIFKPISVDDLKKKDIPDDEIKSKKFKQVEIEHTVKNNKYMLDLGYESRGTERYYGLAGLLDIMVNKSVLFAVDELEESLHPDLYKHFLISFLINSKESQLVATTHNREFLQDKDLFRNDAIWITDKNNEECATKLYSLKDFDTSVIRNTSSIYNAYKIGKLGGVPKLGDYYYEKNDDKK